ncbi:MAG: 50S ribosomal protein L17 [Janthinobacterium lividum]
MRHGKKVNHLGRTDSHRKAMMANMASSLILHKRITTTLAKAKALRGYVEPLLTKSKNDTTHSRRTVFSYLKDKETVTILFREIAEKIANRPGGYTRIVKLENRLGDNAEMAIIELVDYNTVYVKGDSTPEKKPTRRRGSGSNRGNKADGDVDSAQGGIDSPLDQAAPATSISDTDSVGEELAPDEEL